MHLVPAGEFRAPSVGRRYRSSEKCPTLPETRAINVMLKPACNPSGFGVRSCCRMGAVWKWGNWPSATRAGGQSSRLAAVPAHQLPYRRGAFCVVSENALEDCVGAGEAQRGCLKAAAPFGGAPRTVELRIDGAGAMSGRSTLACRPRQERISCRLSPAYFVSRSESATWLLSHRRRGPLQNCPF